MFTYHSANTSAAQPALVNAIEQGLRADIGMTLTSHNALYSGSVPWWKAIYDDKRRCQGQLFEKE